MRLPLPIATTLGSTALALACAGVQVPIPAPEPTGPKPAVTSPAALCEDPTLAADDFCLPAGRVEPLLRSDAGEILYHKITESGVSRPSVLYLSYAEEGGEPIVIKAKWKIAPPGGHGFNNEPHKEMAAYEAQKLFLDASEYVVPPTVGVCMPLEKHARSLGEAAPTFEGTRCVFGVLAYWLESVTPEHARDMQRFDADADYRDALARLNLLTYLIGHRDPRDANFLISTDPDRPRVFAIDNGLAFSGFSNPFTFYYGDWGKIRVPALRRDDVERLRGVTREHLDALAVVAQFENVDGMLVPAEAGVPLDPDEPVRVTSEQVQFGLTRSEIDSIEMRVRKLLEQVDAGEIEVY